VGYDYPISAMMNDTPLAPQGVLAMPGRYTVKLTVDGVASVQPLTLKMDPRVLMSAAQLRTQFTLAQKIASLMAMTASDKRLARYNFQLSALFDAVEGADAPPTTAVIQAVRSIELTLQRLH
jgi:hypothetical protein